MQLGGALCGTSEYAPCSHRTHSTAPEFSVRSHPNPASSPSTPGPRTRARRSGPPCSHGRASSVLAPLCPSSGNTCSWSLWANCSGGDLRPPFQAKDRNSNWTFVVLSSFCSPNPSAPATMATSVLRKASHHLFLASLQLSPKKATQRLCCDMM